MPSVSVQWIYGSLGFGTGEHPWKTIGPEDPLATIFGCNSRLFGEKSTCFVLWSRQRSVRSKDYNFAGFGRNRLDIIHCKVVPHELSAESKANRVDICQKKTGYGQNITFWCQRANERKHRDQSGGSKDINAFELWSASLTHWDGTNIFWYHWQSLWINQITYVTDHDDSKCNWCFIVFHLGMSKIPQTIGHFWFMNGIWLHLHHLRLRHYSNVLQEISYRLFCLAFH
jgi:hypothetical protein